MARVVCFILRFEGGLNCRFSRSDFSVRRTQDGGGEAQLYLEGADFERTRRILPRFSLRRTPRGFTVSCLFPSADAASFRPRTQQREFFHTQTAPRSKR